MPEIVPIVLPSDRPPQGVGEVLLGAGCAGDRPGPAACDGASSTSCRAAMTRSRQRSERSASGRHPTGTVKFSVNGRPASFDGPDDVPAVVGGTRTLAANRKQIRCSLGSCGTSTMHFDGAPLRTRARRRRTRRNHHHRAHAIPVVRASERGSRSMSRSADVGVRDDMMAACAARRRPRARRPGHRRGDRRGVRCASYARVSSRSMVAARVGADRGAADARCRRRRRRRRMIHVLVRAESRQSPRTVSRRGRLRCPRSARVVRDLLELVKLPSDSRVFRTRDAHPRRG